MAQCTTTALAGAVPRLCVRGARVRFGGLGPVPGVVSLPFPPSCPASPALRVAGHPVRVSLTLARWYAIPRGLCVPRAQSGCPSGSPRVPSACVCARAPAASAPPPPLGGVVCAPRAVPALGSGRAVPRGPCPSACPAPVPCSVWRARGGGRSGPGSPLHGLGLLLRGASEVRRSPSPTARPLGGLPGPTTHWLWVRGGAGMGTRHQPHSARSCEPALRAAGAARRRPGGAPPAWVWGVRGRALSHPLLPALLAGCRGPLPTVCGCGGVRAWGPVTDPTARALASCLCALWGRHKGTRGGRLLPGCAASGVGRSPNPRLPALWAGCRGPLPTGCGCGGCGRGDPSPTPQRALLRAGFARCGGGTRAPRGGASCLGCGRLGSGALPPPTARPLGGLQGPTTHWLWVRGGCSRGDPSPTPQRPLLRAGFARYGSGTRAPGGGASCLGVGRPGSGALPPPNARPLGGLAGPTTHWLWVRGGAGVGTRHQPHSARSCTLWGRHEGARGGRLLPGCGASWAGRSPTPDCPPSGRAAGAHYPLAVGAGGCGRGDPSPTPQRALVRAGFARCGGGMRVPGGGASCLGVGRPGSGALPAPTARPLGGLPGPTTHWLWVRGGAGVGTRHQPHSARSCFLRGRHEGARGGRLLPGCGASRVGRSPTPDCPPSERVPGPTTHWLWVRGGCGRGDPSPTPQRALLRAVGAA